MNRTQSILKMLETHTEQEVGEVFGITRQRVSQIALEHEMEVRDREKGWGTVRRRIVESGLLGKMSDTKLAKKLGFSQASVSSVRNEMGIEAFQENQKERTENF